MNFKRLELYVGWTCNQKCTYCIEFPSMEDSWNKKVTKYEILKELIKYKKLGYNHVTFLGGEPFIQAVFLDSLLLGKKLGYTILVTTNCTTLHLEHQAKKFLPYIDELILSVEAISVEDQQKISRTSNYVHWEKVFENIKKYWDGTFFKVNIVITQDNKDTLYVLVQYLYSKGMKNIAITYPDLDMVYNSKDHILEKIAPKYEEIIEELKKILDFSLNKGIKLKIVDIPLCILVKNLDYTNTHELSDDYDYGNRLKVGSLGNEMDRESVLPRRRKHISACQKCIYKNTCWGPSIHYDELYGLDEINPIK